jgi:glycosyltransferase involved in cell wall biosynthesis
MTGTAMVGRPSEPARILVIHERYRQGGGEDAVVEAEVAMLREHGHLVATHIVDNATIPTRRSPSQTVALAAGTIWSRSSARMVRELVATLRPGVVHVHNTLPLLSPAIFSACKAEGAATVMTLHNYRLVCPAATLYRDGQPCEDCVGRPVALPAIRHACYRGSRGQTSVIAAMLAVHSAVGTWTRHVDRFVALSKFARDVFIDGGLPAGRIAIKPNFVRPDPGPGGGGDGFLFAGRLVPEKGPLVLLQAWRSVPGDVTCRLVGGGPLEAEVRAASLGQANLTVLGPIERTRLLAELRASRALIMPSTWYEGLPLVALEAFACGVPVIASRLGSMIEIVEPGVTGLLVAPGDPDDLARAIRWASDHPVEMRRMGAAARARYLADYTSERNYPRLLAIYHEAMERAQPVPR